MKWFDFLRDELARADLAFFAAPKEAPMTVDEAVARYIEILESYAGIGAHSARPRFMSLFAPPFDAGSATFFATPDVKDVANSTCGVFQVAALYHLLDELGLLDLAPELHGPIGADWLQRLSALAKRLRALRTPHDGAPGLACIVYVAIRIGLVTHQHWYALVRELGGGRWNSADGGSDEKDDEGHAFQAIAIATRELRAGYDVTAQKPIVQYVCVRTILEALLAARASGPAVASGGTGTGGAGSAAATATASPGTLPAGSEIVDLSAANGHIDFGILRDAGVRLVILRMTLGRVSKASDIDSKVRDYAKDARAAGLLLTGYSLGFARHGAPQDAREQARDAVKLWREIGGDLVPFVDWEREPGDEGVTREELRDAALFWAEGAELELKAAPGVYCGAGWWDLDPLLVSASELARCALWASDFEASREIGRPLLPSPPGGAPAPWQAAAIHQYAGSRTKTGRVGAIAGIGGALDRSRALVALDGLRVSR